MRSQIKSISHASIVVVELVSEDTVAIEAISITLESCDLSGAWQVNLDDTSTLDLLLNDKLIICVNGESESLAVLKNYQEKFITINSLIEDAKVEIQTANNLFDNYVQKNQIDYLEFMKIPAAERKSLPKVVKKSLVAPEFSEWPDSVILDSAEIELAQRKKLGAVEGTPSEMKKILAASRLIQLLVYMWKADEIERVNRVYVLGQDSVNTILPPSWLKKITWESF